MSVAEAGLLDQLAKAGGSLRWSGMDDHTFEIGCQLVTKGYASGGRNSFACRITRAGRAALAQQKREGK